MIKTLLITLSITMVILSVLSVDDFIIKQDKSIEPKIILPEQYKMIDSTTAIIGHFNSKGELVIEFDNRIQFEWEGLTKDIPQDGIRELQLTTNENTVYLNPVDE